MSMSRRSGERRSVSGSFVRVIDIFCPDADGTVRCASGGDGRRLSENDVGVPGIGDAGVWKERRWSPMGKSKLGEGCALDVGREVEMLLLLFSNISGTAAKRRHIIRMHYHKQLAERPLTFPLHR